ncbi:LD-carboxypeptidase [Ponticaulis sp.]|uniref:LD-carboxypeptidase n=1 Tax=Ponticaulis sp. TaxID=2020902 RepID=UPI000B762054|nr:LD-carboxypeptidase [Ponticaulis sp.]MAI90422.1 LD-carboxypeptidase [Ponticaulis sp.]OUY00123.1 MAG: LD-carboxypeptidase [Hyphomonadaceae bacterium TMED5]|tara:strand:- start:36388 stop:37224 length:837 start_codon:yes stop_codon:yes gene_type:complete
MGSSGLTIGVVAPAKGIDRETAEKVTRYAYEHYGSEVELRFHPQCFLRHGHFAGTDEARSLAFLEYANSPDIDAIWAARGGYGCMRLYDSMFERLNANANAKAYIGYSDFGAVLARLYKMQIGRPIHGPVTVEINRTGGEACIARVLDYLTGRSLQGIEPTMRTPHPRVAINLTIIEHLIGTPWMPDLSGHVLMVEDVGEYEYAIDRKMFTLCSNENIRNVHGIALGRCSDIPENEIAFGMTYEESVQDWCHRSGIPYLGRADIGHDVDNKMVVWGQG